MKKSKRYDARCANRFVSILCAAIAAMAITTTMTGCEIDITTNGENANESITIVVSTSYENGQKYYNTGNYAAAIGELSKVPVESEDYEDAQIMLADAIDKYRTATLDRVNIYINNSEYEAALTLIAEAQLVLPDDADFKNAYDSACTAYVDSVIAEANAYIEAEDYETALSILSIAKSKYPADTRLEESYVTTFAAYKSFVCQNAISNAEQHATNGNYANAIQTLNAAVAKVGEIDSLMAKLKTYEEVYANTVIKAAKAQYEEYNAQSIFIAESMLNEAIAILPDNTALKDELLFYKEREPISVLDLEWVSPQTNPSTWLKDYGQITDANGNVHEHAISVSSWYCSRYTDTCSGDAGYDLDYQYKKITGTLVLMDYYKNATATTTVTMWDKDGKQHEFVVTSGSESVSFSLDISGRQDIQIWMEHSTSDEEVHYAYLTELYVWK